MQKALFLDRDGVINVEKDYLYKIEDFEFIDGIVDLCKYYQDLDYLIIIVTNQSGIARGYYTEEDFTRLSEWMIKAFAKNQVLITHIYYCPHHPSISGECDCRKPQPGMLIQAQKDFNIDLKNSLLVGDKERDIEAAIKAGIETTYLFDEYNRVSASKATYIVDKLENIWKNNVNTQ
ncbi:D-glycero-beta-D-manno-heptose 1,7-bisphosphate 7-phosphatase [Sulfurimonas sp.]